MAVIEYLKKIPLFESLKEEDFVNLAEQTLVRNYTKKTFICLEDNQGEYVFFILAGLVKLTKGSGEGREKTLHILQEGQYFGETCLFDEGCYNSTAESVNKAMVALIPCKTFEEFLHKNPIIALKMLKELSKKLRSAQRQIKNLSLKNSHNRMAIRLFKLAREYGEPQAQGIKINLTLSHQELADFISASRETATRILNEFEKLNIIVIDKQNITIINEKKLRDWM